MADSTPNLPNRFFTTDRVVASAAVLTTVFIGLQVWIMWRQAGIADEQTKIAQQQATFAQQ
jgi:hypothetical protein